jgi:hypothetical protein
LGKELTEEPNYWFYLSGELVESEVAQRVPESVISVKNTV